MSKPLDPQAIVSRAAQQECLLSWVLAHELKTPKGHAIEFIQRPYLIDLYLDNSPNMVVQKAAQIGISTWAIFDALRFCMLHRDPAVTVIFTQPTTDDAQKFSSTRVSPIIDASRDLSMQWTGGTEVRRVGFPNPSIIHFRGTWVEKAAYTIDSDANIHDELDKSKPDVREIYDERLGASQYKKTRDISTPTIPKFGVSKLFDASDGHEWLVSCVGCSWEGELNYYEHLDRVRCLFRCPKCGKTLTRSRGRWVAKRPDSQLRGYHISQCMAPFIPIGPATLKGSLMFKEINTRLKRNFYNFTLGLPSSEGVGQVSRDTILQKCFLEDYQHHEAGKGAVMGVDVGNWKYVEIAYAEKTGLVDLEGMEVIRSRVIHLEKTTSWARVKSLMHIYGVEVCVVDASPERDMARNFAREFRGRVFCCDYANISEPVRWQGKEPYFILAERTQTLNIAADSIIKGYTYLYSLPDEEIDDLGTEDGWIQHWENMRLLQYAPEETKSGQPVEEWVSVGADHRAHAHNYCRLAALKWQGTVRLPDPEKTVRGKRKFKSEYKRPRGMRRELPKPTGPP